jgi:hypothetical protein
VHFGTTLGWASATLREYEHGDRTVCLHLQTSRRLAEAPEEEVDEETIARILAAEAERGESISHAELK